MQPAAREKVEQLQELLLLDQVGHSGRVDRGHGHDGQRAIDDQDGQDEDDAPADIRRTERVDQRVEHGSVPLCVNCHE